ncbi:hypothetical protein ISCGN_032420 [Ixodes scapularis]
MTENPQNRYAGTTESGDPYQLLQNLQTAAKATIATQKKKIHLEKQSLEKEIAEARSQAPVYENQSADVNTDEFLYNLQKEADMLQSTTNDVNEELWQLTDQLQAAKDTCTLYRLKMKSLEKEIFKWNTYADKEERSGNEEAGMAPCKRQGDQSPTARPTACIEAEEFRDEDMEN